MWLPKTSINVLLPTPGTPVMPTRSDWPVCGSTPCNTEAANILSLANVLSTNVMARLSIIRSLRRMPSMYVSEARREGIREFGFRKAEFGTETNADIGRANCKNSMFLKAQTRPFVIPYFVIPTKEESDGDLSASPGLRAR